MIMGIGHSKPEPAHKEPQKYILSCDIEKNSNIRRAHFDGIYFEPFRCSTHGLMGPAVNSHPFME